MIKVSIIVPIYNSQQYLERCINSIINQTEKDIEILLINDGSTDDSEKIIEKIMNKEKRIICINQKNQGVSVARNKGLKEASGKYVVFVDSDDYIELNTIESLYKLIEEKKADVVRYAWKGSNEKLVNKKFFPEEIYPYIIKTREFNSACYQIIKKDLITNNNINFKSGIKYGEDTLFNMNLYLYAQRVFLLSKNYYHYIDNNNSFIRKGSINNIISKCESAIYVYNKLYYYIKKYDVEYLYNDVSKRILFELNDIFKELFYKKINISFYKKYLFIKKYMKNKKITNGYIKLKLKDLNSYKINYLLIKLINVKMALLYSILLHFAFDVKKIFRRKI